MSPRLSRRTLTTRRPPSLFNRKFVSSDGVVALAGLQDHGRELWLVGRIGIVLRCQAERGAARIGEAPLADSFAVEKIAGVKLHARLGGPNSQAPAGGRLCHASGQGSP